MPFLKFNNVSKQTQRKHTPQVKNGGWAIPPPPKSLPQKWYQLLHNEFHAVCLWSCVRELPPILPILKKSPNSSLLHTLNNDRFPAWVGKRSHRLPGSSVDFRASSGTRSLVLFARMSTSTSYAVHSPRWGSSAMESLAEHLDFSHGSFSPFRKVLSQLH